MKQGDIYKSKNYNDKVQIESVDKEYIKYKKLSSTVVVKLKREWFAKLFEKLVNECK